MADALQNTTTFFRMQEDHTAGIRVYFKHLFHILAQFNVIHSFHLNQPLAARRRGLFWALHTALKKDQVIVCLTALI